MGKYIRYKMSEKVLQRKHLKNPLKKVAEVMSVGFSDEEFYECFKKCYPGIWNNIIVQYESNAIQAKNRERRGLKFIYPIQPDAFLRSCAMSIMKEIRQIHQVTVINESERKKKKDELQKRGGRKLAEIMAKESYLKSAYQTVTPPYAQYLIKTYYFFRRKYPLDINSRYLLIIEAAKFKCPKTISFLEQINACEKNNDLRLAAFYCLQKLGLNPRLRKKRRGKTKQTMTKNVDVIMNPTELLRRIYDNQHIIHKRFDIFLSHSYKNKTELLELKEQLNRQGLVVYIDWVNDKEMLNRENQNGDTIKVLFERLNQSSSLLFVQTRASLSSEYTQMEVQHFKTNNRPMFVIEKEPAESILQCFNGLSKCEVINGYVCDTSSGKSISIETIIKQRLT